VALVCTTLHRTRIYWKLEYIGISPLITVFGTHTMSKN